MTMELAAKILNGLKGYLGITVAHPDIAGKLRVVGATADASEFSWADMPDEMRIKGRKVYCCESDWSAGPIFVFADEVEVVDAPAYLVVGALMDRLYNINPDTARRLEDGEDDEVEEED